jgi:RNA polymerase sigma factor (sigma-70 family)
MDTPKTKLAELALALPATTWSQRFAPSFPAFFPALCQALFEFAAQNPQITINRPGASSRPLAPRASLSRNRSPSSSRRSTTRKRKVSVGLLKWPRRLESCERAEDLTQETFLAVIRATSPYEPRALVRTYLYGIVLKMVAAERRTRSRNAPPQPDAVRVAPEEALWVRQALARLDPAERETLMPREFEQLSHAEISELLRLPINTVRSRLFRSRMALKRYLGAEVAQPGEEA